MKILVVEDEVDLNNVICRELKSEGYLTDSCFDGQEALDYLEFGEYDAVILDNMMPVMSGLEVVSRMRKSGDITPVLFLTALDSIEDRVKGLDAGADDYVVKPFSFAELLARLRVLTRKYSETRANEYIIDNLTLNIRTKEVYRDGQILRLSAKEYAILEYLIRNKGRVLSREQIEENIWGFESDKASNIVDVYIRYLRKKVDLEGQTKLIHTIRGSGYVLRLQ